AARCVLRACGDQRRGHESRTESRSHSSYVLSHLIASKITAELLVANRAPRGPARIHPGQLSTPQGLRKSKTAPEPNGSKELQANPFKNPTCVSRTAPAGAFVSRGVNFSEFKPTLS